MPRASVLHDVPARMRDGTILRANVYRPDLPGAWPTLLARTPYGKDLGGATRWLDPLRAVRDGFMVVIQDTRGRFASDGEWVPFAHEGRDGYDTVEWAARLPGASGRVGMFGLSYWGNTQWLAAIAQPPSLGAIAPALTWSEPHDGVFTRGGALEHGLGLSWALEQGLDYVARQDAPPAEISRRVDDLLDELDRLADVGLWELPAAGGPALRRHRVPELGSLAASDDPSVAERCRVAGHYHDVQVPVLNIGGWHDGFLQGVLDNHAGMRALGRESRLVIGPWSHANFSDTIGGLYFGLGARADGGPLPSVGSGDLSGLQLQWFHRHLDRPEATSGDSPVRIFVTGSNEWRESSCWPPADTVEQHWHLRSGHRLSLTPPPADDPADEFVYDPSAPTPTVGGHTLIGARWPAGPVEQGPIETRSDLVVFTSDPLTTDLRVTGRVRLMLHADSTAVATDWVARLCDVHPDGASFNLCDGIVRVAGDARRPQCHEIDLWSLDHVLMRGHRLRLHVTSSSFPRWDRNLNTGNQHAGRYVSALQRIHHDDARRSWLRLPVARER